MKIKFPVSKKICLAVKAFCLLILGGFPYSVCVADGNFSVVNSITRIQARDTIDSNDIKSYTFSSYLQAKNKMFLLAILDYQNDQDLDQKNGRFEVNLGRPFADSSLGWVVRGRSYYQEDSAIAAGLQLNFNSIAGMKPFLEKARARTFLQVLHNENDPFFGSFEVLHYYSFNIVKNRLSVRGYNIFNDGGEEGSVRNLWADLIYTINPRLDIYYRVNHVSRDNGYLGQRGTAHNLGFRINFN